MSEYKPITGELRNSMTYDITTAPNGVSTASLDTSAFCDLCDAIDSVHATLEAENERLRGEWDFWESTHVELPKDADSEHICAGDKLDGYGKTIEVVELRYGRSGWVLISRDGNAYADTFAFSHHRPDTWERIIEDAIGDRIKDDGEFNETINALVARCKALAGDAE